MANTYTYTVVVRNRKGHNFSWKLNAGTIRMAIRYAENYLKANEYKGYKVCTIKQEIF